MNVKEKKKFVLDVFAIVKQDILNRIHLMPDNWDGFELRQYIADKMQKDIAYLKMDKGRKRDYNNSIRVIGNL